MFVHGPFKCVALRYIHTRPKWWRLPVLVRVGEASDSWRFAITSPFQFLQCLLYLLPPLLKPVLLQPWTDRSPALPPVG